METLPFPQIWWRCRCAALHLFRRAHECRGKDKLIPGHWEVMGNDMLPRLILDSTYGYISIGQHLVNLIRSTSLMNSKHIGIKPSNMLNQSQTGDVTKNNIEFWRNTNWSSWAWDRKSTSSQLWLCKLWREGLLKSWRKNLSPRSTLSCEGHLGVWVMGWSIVSISESCRKEACTHPSGPCPRWTLKGYEGIEDVGVIFLHYVEERYDDPGDIPLFFTSLFEEAEPLRGGWQIWEAFAHAKIQQKQFCCVVAYLPVALEKDNALLKDFEMRFKCLLQSFEQAQGVFPSDLAGLHDKMTRFKRRLDQCLQGILKSLTAGTTENRSFEFDAGINYQRFNDEADRWSRLSAEASEIAAEIAKLPHTIRSLSVPTLPPYPRLGRSVLSPCIADSDGSPLDSWKLVSDSGSPRDSRGLSAASMESEMSCLSGHGGPHCFLPSYLFKTQSAEAVAFICAQDSWFQTFAITCHGNTISILSRCSICHKVPVTFWYVDSNMRIRSSSHKNTMFANSFERVTLIRAQEGWFQNCAIPCCRNRKVIIVSFLQCARNCVHVSCELLALHFEQINHEPDQSL